VKPPSPFPSRPDAAPYPTPELPDDALWMQRALELARAAGAIGEVPVGAVIVRAGAILGEAHNLTRTDDDPTAHAEMVALRRAARRSASSRLLDATMYVTLEPCSMCAGALVLAKVERLVYAAADPKTGMCGSLGCIVQDRRLNHRLQLTAGVLAEPAGELLRAFFRARR
jgi:tRNA(adenine34) deaminase